VAIQQQALIARALCKPPAMPRGALVREILAHNKNFFLKPKGIGHLGN
jgi:hypothetical protein